MSNVRDVLARTAADVDLKERVGQVMTDERWCTALRLYNEVPEDERDWHGMVHKAYQTADAQLAALAAAGLVVVPIEPTAEMLEVGGNEEIAAWWGEDHNEALGELVAEKLYRVMLAAAPKP